MASVVKWAAGSPKFHSSEIVQYRLVLTWYHKNTLKSTDYYSFVFQCWCRPHRNFYWFGYSTGRKPELHWRFWMCIEYAKTANQHGSNCGEFFYGKVWSIRCYFDILNLSSYKQARCKNSASDNSSNRNLNSNMNERKCSFSKILSWYICEHQVNDSKATVRWLDT